MKYYKDEIDSVNTDDAILGEHYHIWTPGSIRNYWKVKANNIFLRNQFYPREYFLNFFRQISDHLKNVESIVDVGCGSGTVLSILDEFRFGNSLTGIDLSDESLSKLREKYEGNAKFSFKVGRINSLPLEDNACDVVTCTEVLEHLFPEDFKNGLSEVSRVLRKGGYLIATVPLDEKINFVVCPECLAIFAPYQHMLLGFTKEYLKEELRKNGLKLMRFYYPVNTAHPKNFIKYVIKNKIIIPYFPKIARKLFPIAGVTGFVALKK